jgi:hypothetical protein
MRHYHNHTEGFEKDWKLIRETASSQKFRVTTEKTKIEVDIHYTAEKILTVNLVVEGHATKDLLVPVMDMIGRLGLSRGDYAVIDYTLSDTEHLGEGHYSIDKEDRKYRRRRRYPPEDAPYSPCDRRRPKRLR